MTKDTMIGVDLAKHVFQARGFNVRGGAVSQEADPATVSAVHVNRNRAWWRWRPTVALIYWASEMARLGHEAKLVAPRYVTPFIKRPKNGAADAEAIVEAAQRPGMRFVETKTEAQKARAILFRTREQLVRQRTDLINALRAHLYEYGYIVAQGIGHLGRLEEILNESNSELPELVRDHGRVLLEQIAGKTEALRAWTDGSRTWPHIAGMRAACRPFWRRADYGPGNRSLRAAARIVPLRPRLRRLARPRSKAAFLRWQTAPRASVQGRAARHSSAPNHRRDVAPELARPQIDPRRFVAGSPGSAKTAYARG